jgi:hypothetical protein
MKETSNNYITRRLLPCAATVLSLSLAVSLRVENVCSAGAVPPPEPPPLIYPYPSLELRGDLQGDSDARQIMLTAIPMSSERLARFALHRRTAADHGADSSTSLISGSDPH